MPNRGTDSRNWRARWDVDAEKGELWEDSGLHLRIDPAENPGQWLLSLADALPEGYEFDSFLFWRLQTEALRTWQERVVGLGHKKVLVKIPDVDVVTFYSGADERLVPGLLQSIRRESKDRFDSISEDDVLRIVQNWREWRD